MQAAFARFPVRGISHIFIIFIINNPVFFYLTFLLV